MAERARVHYEEDSRATSLQRLFGASVRDAAVELLEQRNLSRADIRVEVCRIGVPAWRQDDPAAPPAPVEIVVRVTIPQLIEPDAPRVLNRLFVEKRPSL